MANPVTDDGTDTPYETRQCEVALSEVIDYNLEGFLDLISERAFGSILLMDISYDIVRLKPQSQLVISVTGDVSEINADS